jgi:hypothetical protein
MAEGSSINVRVDFLGLLTILFIGLKLGRVIDWPWIWVASPLWGPLLIAMVVWFLAVAVERKKNGG